jgi:hypothetical protein
MSEKSEGAKLVEVVHLAFLQVLPSYMPVKDYVVKGGANLRLWFDSRRRSQDIDLDYLKTDRFYLVEDQIDKTLAARAFREILRSGGVSISDPTKPKQTDTTRRWKFVASAAAGYLNTKIEFSSRNAADPEHSFDQARADIGAALGLRVVKAEHYLAPAATRQKIGVLAGRSETEPRDVFDLDLLFRSYPNALKPGQVDPALIDKAANAAMSIDYAAYQELVVEFLEEEFVPIYGREEVWSNMVLEVVERLEALK